MKSPDPLPEDPSLRALLRAAHPAPSLPPRFQEGVWRRLQNAERPRLDWSFLRELFRPLWQPGPASLGLAATVAVAIWLGFASASPQVRALEQSRYLAAVSPFHRPVP